MFLMVIAFINGIFINSVNQISLLVSAHTVLPELNINSLATVLPFNSYSNIIFYFLLGGILLREQEKLRLKYNTLIGGKIIPFLMITIGLLGLIEIKHFQIGTFRWANINIVGGYSYVSTVLLSMGIFLLMQMRNAHNLMIELVGRNTMGIYYIHFILLDFLANRFYGFLNPNGFWAMNTIKTITIALICLIITLVLKKIPGAKNIVR